MLTEIFTRVVQSWFGIDPLRFRFNTEEGQSPVWLSGNEIWFVVLGYYAVVLVSKYIMKDRKPLQIKSLIIAHNFVLCFASLVLLLLLVENVAPVLFTKGGHYAVCSEHMFDNNVLEFLYYLNYLFKYYELVDTLFLVGLISIIKVIGDSNTSPGSHEEAYTVPPLVSPLYDGHIVLRATQRSDCGGNNRRRRFFFDDFGQQWVPITLNLFVHVLMYYYYARAAMGARIWWKKYLTSLQITQFIIDLFVGAFIECIIALIGVFAVYYCTFYRLRIIREYFPRWTEGVTCYGTEKAALIGCFILTSYLGLFVQFFVNTYSKEKSA